MYRYTVWLKFNGTENRAAWGEAMVGEELYEHKGDDGTDFNAFENINLAPDSGTASLRKSLFERLLKRFGPDAPA